ncbi:hypothetical protein [Caldisphaera sp.]|uniref:hypothetical protein n=1 Tax=Caldisphaera sp. TaxID=2060322 RepID=UPI0025C713FD|nr:hypothetical protein [Caldisphaera sp.]
MVRRKKETFVFVLDKETAKKLFSEMGDKIKVLGEENKERRKRGKGDGLKRAENSWNIIEEAVVKKLLDKGEMTVSELAKEVSRELKKNRSYVYLIIWALRKAGALKEDKRGKNIYVRL